MKYLNKLN